MASPNLDIKVNLDVSGAVDDLRRMAAIFAEAANVLEQLQMARVPVVAERETAPTTDGSDR